MIRRDQN